MLKLIIKQYCEKNKFNFSPGSNKKQNRQSLLIFFNNFDLTLKTILPILLNSPIINIITEFNFNFKRMHQLSELIKKPHELRCDYVLTDNKIIFLTEIQAQNLDDFALRNLEYLVSATRQYNMPVYQVMFYIGQDPLSMKDTYELNDVLFYKFKIINFSSLDTNLFLNQPNIYIKLLSILTKDGKETDALTHTLKAISRMPNQRARVEAINILTTLSNLRKESIIKINNIIKENNMPIIINPEDTDFYRIGLNKGKAEGKVEGKAETLQKLINVKFGSIDQSLAAKIEQATIEELDHYLINFVTASSVMGVFKQ